jgi:peptide/nickel transport system substrate-binding protein
MLSYFQCSQVSVDKSDFSNYYNDAGFCDETYDQLYKQQNTELDLDKRTEIVHEMLTRFYTSAGYIVTATSPDLQAYRSDRFTGWVKQPAETGPVLFSNTSPTYWNLTPTGESSSESGLSTAGIVAIVIAGLIAIGLVGWYLSRRRTAEERE